MALVEIVYLIIINIDKVYEHEILGASILNKMYAILFTIGGIIGLIYFVEGLYWIIKYLREVIYYIGVSVLIGGAIFVFFWANYQIAKKNMNTKKVSPKDWKYKPGDKVILKKGLKNEKYYGCKVWGKQKEQYAGKKVTIESYDEDKRTYHIEELDSQYHITEAMISKKV